MMMLILKVMICRESRERCHWDKSNRRSAREKSSGASGGARGGARGGGGGGGCGCVGESVRGGANEIEIKFKFSAQKVGKEKSRLERDMIDGVGFS